MINCAVDSGSICPGTKLIGVRPEFLFEQSRHLLRAHFREPLVAR